MQVNNELVLSLDNGLVLIKHLLGLLTLALVIARHVLTHVVEGMQLLVQTSDLVILDNDELIQLFDFFLGVSLLSLVTLEHGEKTVNTFIAGIAEISDDPLTHLHLLLVVFEFRCDFLSIPNQVSQVLLLSDISILNLANILAPHIDAFLLEDALVLSFGHEDLLVVAANFCLLFEKSKCVSFSLE